MESLRVKQYRCLKQSLFNGTVYSNGNDCLNYLKSNPLKKTVQEIEFVDCKPPTVMEGTIIETKGSIFQNYVIEFNHTSQDMHVITKDNKIIYFTFSSIYAPALTAFRTLTECFNTYNNDGKTMYVSLNNAIVKDSDKNVFTTLTGKQTVYETKQISNIDEYLKKLYYWY